MEYQSVPALKGLKLLALSNFLAAFGGGTILGRAMGVLAQVPWLNGDSLLAFLAGGLLGLGLLSVVPEKWATRAPAVLSLFSVTGSLALLFIFERYQKEGALTSTAAWCFFGILCVRFSLWFLARVLRSDIASGHGQKVSWVELFYSCGVILGLVVWQRSGLPISLPVALSVDMLMQSLAALGDAGFCLKYLRYLKVESTPPSGASGVLRTRRPFPFGEFALLALVPISITAGHQLVGFAFAHLLQAETQTAFATDIIAATYFGAALGGIFCGLTQLRFALPLKHPSWWRRSGRVIARLGNGRWEVPMVLVIVTSMGMTGLSFLGWKLDWMKPVWVLSVFIVGAICFEIILLAIVDYIGERGKESGKTGMVAYTYGFMSVIGGLVLLAILHSPSPEIGIILTTVLCVVIANWSLAKSLKNGVRLS